MKPGFIHIGSVACETVHTRKFVTDVSLDVEKLAREISIRGRDVHDWRWRFDLKPTDGSRCYTVTVSNEEAFSGFFDIVAEIEADVLRAREQERLLTLISK